ncbi:helix-turn-helix domain-containing protein [Sphingomonas aurantiaca]
MGQFTPDALGWLTTRRWPGNVRELRAAVECAAALAPQSATGVDVGATDLAFAVGDPVADLPTIGTPQTLEEEIAALEYRRITETLARTGHNHTHTARHLGLSRVGLLKKLDRMGLR